MPAVSKISQQVLWWRLNPIANGADRALNIFPPTGSTLLKLQLIPTVEPTNAQVEFIDRDNRRMHRTQIAAL
jgi:hypothetical protein